MEKILAAKFYQNKKNQRDDVLWLLESLKLIKQNPDLTKVIAEYKRILTKELVIAEVITSVELNDNQKRDIQTKVTKKFDKSELVFLFNVDKKVEGGIVIYVGDNLVEFN